MSDQPTVQVVLAPEIEGGSHEVVLDETAQLHSLLDEYAFAPTFAPDGEPVEGRKGDPLTVALLVAVTPVLIEQLLTLAREWAGSDERRTLTIELQGADGKSLKLTYDQATPLDEVERHVKHAKSLFAKL